MFWCDKCKIWEHEKCLADAIKKDYIKSRPSGQKNRKSLGKRMDITIATNEANGEVTAYVEDKDRKIEQENKHTGGSNVVNTTSHQVHFKTTVPVKCLKCGTQLK